MISARYAELLISLTRRDAVSYTVEPLFSPPGADADVEVDPGSATFDLDALEDKLEDVPGYGALLTQCLFADPKVRTTFDTARAMSTYRAVPLRVRLFIDASAQQLHALRWETMRDPQDGSSLLADERILFSRYLRSPEWRLIQPRPRGELRALVAVANPTDLASYGPEGRPLQAIDVAAELDRARAGLGTIPVTALASGGQATVKALHERLREGYDILYLVCHGALRDGEPRLYLENEDGTTDVVGGEELADELSGLYVPPTLVVLASCESAGSGARGALSALGPRLARAAIPAVLAMQGKVSVQTSASFMRRFFAELGTEGQIDQAVARARGEIKDRPDAWMPVLFTRLRMGYIWSVPSSEAGLHRFEDMDSLIASIRDGRCTPILGPGLIEFLAGSPRDLARSWATCFRFPMSPDDQDDLPQVAQFLSVRKGEDFPRATLQQYLRDEIQKRYSADLPDTLRGHGAPLESLIQEVGRRRREQDETEAHRVLANLPLPIYITTNPDDLLANALLAVGKQPVVELCRWREDTYDWPASVFDEEPGYKPTPERPLVYHLFGHMKHRDSVLLTQDDYFDYLTGISTNPGIIPNCVMRAWASTALFFLGFQVDDWNFRILFRSILNQEGSGLQRIRGRSGSRTKKYVNVAVQMDPEEGRSLLPPYARRYLEEAFGIAGFTIYWGSSQQFVKELWAQWGTPSGGRDNVYASATSD